MRQRILTHTISMKFFRKLFNIKVKRRVMWLEVPMDCTTRYEKDNVILSTLETLEQTIKIN